MDRRQFLGGVACGAGTLALDLCAGLPVLRARAAYAAPVTVPRTLVHVMLIGGADIRFLFSPAPGSSYGDLFWQARQGLYVDEDRKSLYSSHDQMWAAEYVAVTDPLSGAAFGIHRNAGWLYEQFEAGNVAIVANTLGSTNRRHDHSQLIVQAGDRLAGRFPVDRDGWGGRLCEAIGGDARSAVMSYLMPVFVRGTDSASPLAQVIQMPDSRHFNLPGPTENELSSRSILVRALTAYYAARGAEIETERPEDWPYRRFFEHERSIRSFGGAFETRLLEVAPEPPASLVAFQAEKPENQNFGLQCATLYDCLMANDVLGMRVAHLSHQDWDTHVLQKVRLESNIDVVFGAAGGLARVWDALAPVSGAHGNVSFVFNTDFGRQFMANGGAGTDHGIGNCTIMVGGAVNGGVLGELFPAREAEPDPDDPGGRPPLLIPGQDIRGLTAFDHVFGAACDWVEPGAGELVFPERAGAGLEPGVVPSALFL